MRDARSGSLAWLLAGLPAPPPAPGRYPLNAGERDASGRAAAAFRAHVPAG